MKLLMIAEVSHHVAFGCVLNGLNDPQSLFEAHLFNHVCADRAEFLPKRKKHRHDGWISLSTLKKITQHLQVIVLKTGLANQSDRYKMFYLIGAADQFEDVHLWMWFSVIGEQRVKVRDGREGAVLIGHTVQVPAHRQNETALKQTMIGSAA